MKLFLYSLVLGLLPLAQAVSSQKSFIVTYPKDTPDSILTSAKDAITEAVSRIQSDVRWYCIQC